MPDKWEYPWYAAWDLAFHVLALTLVDPDFGKQQLKLMLRERYLHPNGQIPAYEWNFGDVNPPVHAWATIFTYRLEKAQHGRGRHRVAQALLPEAAAELHLVGQPQGPHRAERVRGRLPRPRQHRRVRPQRAAADRRLPGAGRRHRLDGAVLPEHARDRRRAGDDRPGLRGHGAQVRRALPVDRLVDDARWAATPACGTRRTASSTTCCGCPTASAQRLKVRSMVGLLPLCAVDGLRGRAAGEVPGARRAVPAVPRGASRADGRHPRPDASRASRAAGWRRSWTRPSCAACWRRCSTRTSSSARTASARCRATTPSIRTCSTSAARSTASRYLPAESDTGMFGGNSNWRGPIWMPVNALIIRALLQYYTLLRRRLHRRMPDRLRPADDPVSRSPRRSARRLASIFLRDEDGRRPVYGGTREVPGRPALARSACCSTSTSTATTAPASAPATRPAGPGSSPGVMHLFATITPEQVLKSARWPTSRQPRGEHGR